MNKEIKSIEYVFLPEDEESILTSHYFNKGIVDILLWGEDLSKDLPYEEWKAGLSPERKAKILKEGYETRALTFCQTGKVSHLIDDKKIKYE